MFAMAGASVRVADYLTDGSVAAKAAKGSLGLLIRESNYVVCLRV